MFVNNYPLNQESCNLFNSSSVFESTDLKDEIKYTYFNYQEKLKSLGISSFNLSYKLIHKIYEISCLLFIRISISLPISMLLPFLPAANVIFPSVLTKTIYRTLTLPTILIANFLESLLPTIPIIFSYGNRGVISLTHFVVMGVMEEIIFREVIQRELLTHLPKLILKKFAPNHVKYVDHVIARIARIVFTSLLFALAHTATFGTSSGLLLSQFIGGTLYSIWVEKNYSIPKIAAVHILFNLTIVAMTGGFPL